MEQVTVLGQTGYFIRAVLKEGEYDIAPALTRISMNVCPVVQRDTFAECIVQENVQGSIRLDTELSVLGARFILERMEFFIWRTASKKRLAKKKVMWSFILRMKGLPVRTV